MKILLITTAILAALLALVACGGGTHDTVISGVASKGIIRNGTIKVFAVSTDGTKSQLLKESTTDNNGAYRVNLGRYTGPVLVEASGSYTDEATGATITIGSDAPLRAIIAASAAEVSMAVTPLTELAVEQNLDPVTGRFRLERIDADNALIASLFKVDILRTMPVDSLSASPMASTGQKEYALALAGISDLMRSRNMDLHGVIGLLRDTIAAGNAITAPVAAEFLTAVARFATGTGNRTGITDISTTALFAIGGQTRSLALSVAGTTSSIAAIEMEIVLPPGSTVKADADGKVDTSVLQPLGAPGTMIIAGHYSPPTSYGRGSVRIAIVSASGFAAGEFLTLQYQTTHDVVPTGADFVMSVLSAYDAQLASLGNLSLSARLL